MGAIGEMPAAVAALPASFRRQILKQCAGDWRRVTCDGGAITVHNQPQRDLDLDLDPDTATSALRPEPEEECPPPPLRPLRTTIRPRTLDVDTSAFTREELPTVGPPKKRAPKQKPKPEPVPAPEAVRPSPALFAATPRPTPQPRRPAPQVRLLPPAPPASQPELAPETTTSKRSGTPRTALELMKRLLDLGCKFQRLERSDFAKVYYRGNLVEVIRCSDSLSRDDVAAEYQKVRDVLRARGWLSQEKTETTRRSG